MKTKSFKNECPDCGYRTIRREYDKCYSNDLLLWVNNQLNDFFPNEPAWSYCQRCGVMFNPLHEAFAVC